VWKRAPARAFTIRGSHELVAFLTVIKSCERFKLEGVDRWREIRAEIHEEVCRQKAFDSKRNTFVQYYGAREHETRRCC
jgi:hypothetical protein